MKIRKISRCGKFTPAKRGFCFLILIGMVLMVILPLSSLYKMMKVDMGMEVAEVNLSLEILIMLVNVFVGIILAYFIDRAICTQSFIFRAPQPGSWVDSLIRMWGFDFLEKQPEIPLVPAQTQPLEVKETLAIVDKPKRRGRKPRYSFERWTQVVNKWENRNLLQDTRTLTEFLVDEFGRCRDGSPQVSNQSYYDWYKKVMLKSKKETEAKNSLDMLNQRQNNSRD